MVIVLALIALVLVLLVSLSSLVQVETRSSAAHKNLMQARQNALLGLDIAVGELQKYAGPDQSVTFSATTFYPTKDVWTGTGELYENPAYGFRAFAKTSSDRSYLQKVETYLTPAERTGWTTALRKYWNGDSESERKNPRWTGVANAALRRDAATVGKFGEPMRDQWPVWLVSGNEKFSLAQWGNATQQPGFYTPNTPLPDPEDKPEDQSVWLVKGGGSPADRLATNDGLDGWVKAPRVGIAGTDGKSMGSYAYWVGDESTKANFAVRDPYHAAAVGSSDYRNRLQAPQRIGWENITGFQSLVTDPHDPDIPKITTPREIPLLDPSKDLRTPTMAGFHDLTAFSKSLFTDTALGGLRKDLTRYLTTDPGALSGKIPDRSLYAGNDPRFNPNGGTINGFPSTDTNLPEWSSVRNWYVNTASGGSISPNADTFPIITYFRLHEGFSYDPASKTIYLHLLPVLMLWNPYDASLASASYTVKVSYKHGWYRVYVMDDATKQTAITRRWTAWGNAAATTLNPLDGTSLVFTLSSGFSPGECRIFSVRNNDIPITENSAAITIPLAAGLDADRPYSAHTPVFTVNGTFSPTRIGALSAAGAGFNPPLNVELELNGTKVWQIDNFADDASASKELLPGGEDKPKRDMLNSGNLAGIYPLLRELPQFAGFRTSIDGSADGTANDDPIFAAIQGELDPLVDSPSNRYRNQYLGKTQRAFATHNLFANFGIRPSPVDIQREKDPKNNTDKFGTVFISTGSSSQKPWDDNQASGNKGFCLLSTKNEESYGGKTLVTGLTDLPMRVTRRADTEVLSPGQFQQVNLSEFPWQPSFPIGNSEASPYVDRNAIAGLTLYPVAGGNGTTPHTFPNPAGNELVDLSFLLNEGLWDRYFLSTIPPDVTVGQLSNDDPLPNSRIRFRNNPALSANDVKNFETAAAHLESHGSLNVNSTSVEAWVALLTAFRDLKMEGGGEKNPEDTVPVSRTLDPPDGPIEFQPAGTTAADYGADGNQNYSKLTGGFRYLDDTQIRALAECIVNEVRLRGPFYSLADFVNRRLVRPAASNSGGAWYQARTENLSGDAPDYTNDSGVISSGYEPFTGLFGINGALQRAINVSGINGGINHPHESPLTSTSSDRVFRVVVNKDGNTSYLQNDTNAPLVIDPAFSNYLDMEHYAGAPAGEAGQLFSHSPGFVTQGDLLAMIGSALTPRGDTFLIRTYGDVMVGPEANRRIEARAWLEAVVQRVPEPCTPKGTSGSDAWEPGDAFGRKFQIVKMRWLGAEEL